MTKQFWTTHHRGVVHIAAPVSVDANTWCHKLIAKPKAFVFTALCNVTCEKCKAWAMERQRRLG